jgi:hypothetical protein
LINENLMIVQGGGVPPVMKRSRAKIWLRTGILTVFGTLFGINLYTDIASGSFRFLWALLVFLFCVPVGFWLRKLVPMQVHPASKHITLSFDRLYFFVILSLVFIKAFTARVVTGSTMVPDIVMCTILGLMVGRLSGICVRVHDLKGNIQPPADLLR